VTYEEQNLRGGSERIVVGTSCGPHFGSRRPLFDQGLLP
jgi:hypothetical protein